MRDDGDGSGGPFHDRLQVLSDFDGTITKDDVMVGLLENFGPEDWYDNVSRWKAGGTTLREALRSMYDSISADREDIEDFIKKEVEVRDGFVEFLRFCREGNIGFRIVSEGLDFVIRTTLADIDPDMDITSNRADFDDGDLSVDFPEIPPVCDHDDGDICGTCKINQVRKEKARGRTVIYMGDGSTDLRPARAADVVFARRALEEDLLEEDIEYHPFRDFHDVRRIMEDLFPL